MLIPVNIEFHYYTVNFLAEKSGCSSDEAEIIAYSSQFVDSNIIEYTIDTGDGRYSTTVTQNYGFWKSEALRNINIPFHFIPGGSLDSSASPRKDGKWSPLLTRPNSQNAKDLLVQSLKTANLYRIGIALHSFADTWAHQNFCGIRSAFNTLEESSVIPPIGHAQAMRNPDFVDLCWEDPRLTAGSVDNRQRFLSAAKKIYRYLCTYNRRDFSDEELVMYELDLLFDGRKSMEERILDCIINQNIEKYSRTRWLKEALKKIEDTDDEAVFKGYNKMLWLRDEMLYSRQLIRKKPVPAAPGFFESHLYKWMEAAKEHQRAAVSLFGDLISDGSRS